MITDHAVSSRYPGRGTTPTEAKTILDATTHIRKLIRQSLGLH
jgi:hypothetical protein